MQKPLAVSAYSLSLRQGQDLLRSVGMSLALIERVFDAFARRQPQSSSWSRVLGEAPERRMDALELFSGLALTCRASTKERLSILFYLFDAGETGVMTDDDLGAMLSSCASVLRNLGLSLPISTDEAAFVAGTAFGRNRRATAGSTASGLAYANDEIDFHEFSAWAQRAEVPGRALEILALPHRFSRLVDLIEAKASSVLRERFLPGSGGPCDVPKENRPAGTKRAWECSSKKPIGRARLQRQRAVRESKFPPPGREGSIGWRTFALPPYLRGIGPHSANVVLEIGQSIDSSAGYSAWAVVVSVEERRGSRFCIVDSRFLGLSGRVPGILRLSSLRAATDHRLTIAWDAAADKRNSRYVTSNFPGSEQTEVKSKTLRFTTLPADAMVASYASGGETRSTVSSSQEFASKRQRSVEEGGRCIEFASMDGSCHAQDARPPDEPSLLLPHPINSSAGHSTTRKGVSVVVSYGQQISLGATDSIRGPGPWWDTATMSPTKSAGPSININPDMLMQSWPVPVAAPNHNVPVSPARTDRGGSSRHSDYRVSEFAPFCGERAHRNVASAIDGADELPWAGGSGPESGDVDVMVHLSPDWRAVEAVRRCFDVLKQCCLESPAVRQDIRTAVSTELTRCIRSLLSKCVRARRGTRGEDNADRCCAHAILGGLQHPWLGLKEVSGGHVYNIFGYWEWKLPGILNN